MKCILIVLIERQHFEPGVACIPKDNKQAPRGSYKKQSDVP
jgi:hypothetical protein